MVKGSNLEALSLVLLQMSSPIPTKDKFFQMESQKPRVWSFSLRDLHGSQIPLPNRAVLTFKKKKRRLTLCQDHATFICFTYLAWRKGFSAKAMFWANLWDLPLITPQESLTMVCLQDKWEGNKHPGETVLGKADCLPDRPGDFTEEGKRVQERAASLHSPGLARFLCKSQTRH